MDKALFMAIACGLCNACVAVATKGAERAGSRGAPFGFVTQMTAVLLACWFVSGNPGSLFADVALLGFGAVMGGLYFAAVLSMLAANRQWPPSVVWACANAGLVVPILLGWLVLAERLHLLDGATLAGFSVMLYGLTSDGKEARQSDSGVGLRPWLMLGAVFAANGLLMFGYKLFAILFPERAPENLAVMLCVAGALLALSRMAACREFPIRGVEWRWGIACGLGVGGAQITIMLAVALPAALLFPVVQGLSLAGGVLACAWVFRERLSPRKLLALTAGGVAVILAALR